MSDRFAIISIILLLLLNIVDATVTIIVIDAGIAKEANPIMDYFLNLGFLPFLMVKLSVVSFASYIFWKYRQRKGAVIGIILSLILYISLSLYFCFALS
tara:strand:+ start:576 stop:872 length:297 start_codon:yes stop_codon:yes gene_type:complete